MSCQSTQIGRPRLVREFCAELCKELCIVVARKDEPRNANVRDGTNDRELVLQSAASEVAAEKREIEVGFFQQSQVAFVPVSVEVAKNDDLVRAAFQGTREVNPRSHALLGDEEESRYRRLVMNRLNTFLLSSGFLIAVSCGPPEGPTGPEKAAAYHAQEAEREDERRNPTAPTEEESTLQFPMCDRKKTPQFPADTEGAVFRAIVFMRITDEGRTGEHCYLALEGPRKYEEKALGDVQGWSYDPEFAGQPRERVVTYRLK